MGTQDKHNIGEFYNRIELLKPTEERDDFNEAKTVLVSVVRNLNAKRVEGSLGEKEAETKGDQAAVSVTDWIIRWFPHIQPRPDWKLIDEYGNTYNIIAPCEPIGRRHWLRIRTRLAI